MNTVNSKLKAKPMGCSDKTRYTRHEASSFQSSLERFQAGISIKLERIQLEN